MAVAKNVPWAVNPANPNNRQAQLQPGYVSPPPPAPTLPQVVTNPGNPYGNTTGWTFNPQTGNWYQPGSASDPAVVAQQQTQTNYNNQVDALNAMFPWLGALGIDPQTLQQWIAEDPNLIGIVEKFRGTSQWAAMFPGIRRDDGTLKMTEGEYLKQQTSYQQLLSQYGFGKSSWSPSDTAAFFTNDLDPNELHQRLDIYDKIERGSDDIKAAFYVYAGMNVSTDDLYQAVIDPSHANQLNDQFNQAAALNPLDYDTWITRATEFGLQSVAQKLTRLQQQGVDTSQAIAQVQSVDPEFARNMMDVLWHGGSQTGPFLNLSQLMASFDYAMIGGAATTQGLALPDQGFVQELRQAGISRADALAGFGQVAQNLHGVQAALQRANRGAFSADDYERAVFLHSPDQQRLLDQAAASEKALGQFAGAPTLGLKNGRLVQTGLASY